MGTGAGRVRQRLILAQFIVGVLACGGLGVYLIASSSRAWLTIGVWLLGAGLSYLPLALHAVALNRPGRLEAELAGLDARPEVRSYPVKQFWIAVPGAVLVAAVVELLTPSTAFDTPRRSHP